jgi:hypothetical protein
VIRRPPASLRHVTAHRTAFLAVAVTVLFTVACVAGTAAFESTVTSIAVRRSLAGAPGTTILASAQASAASAGRKSAIITAEIRTATAGLPVTFYGSQQSQPLDLSSSQQAPSPAQAELLSLPALRLHATLLAGRWPAAAGSGPLQVCASVQPARLLHLSVGQHLTLPAALSGRPVSLHVACVFRMIAPSGPYWSLSPLGSSGISREGGFTLYGPLVASPAALTAAHVPVASVSWLAVPDWSGLRPASLAGLSSRIGAAASDLADSAALGGAQVSTRLPLLLSNLSAALVVARSQLTIGLLILLLMAGAALAVTVRLLSMQREAEAALLAARGAGRRQLAARGITDALLLAVPACAAGPFLGSWMAQLLTRFGPLRRIGLHLNPGQPAAAWLAAAAVAAGCAVIIAMPWLRRPASPVAQRAVRGRQRVVGAALAAGADLALVVLAVLAGWQLAHFSAPVGTGLSGSLGVDPILVSAPVLALAAGATLTLRALPLATRLADGAAASGRGITLPVAAWQVSRRPLRQAGPALLGVLAVAIVVISAAETSSWNRSVQARASFAVGADARVMLPAAAPLPAGEVADVAAAPGVRASTPVASVPVVLPQGAATLLALGSRSAASLSPIRADTGVPATGSLLRRLQPTGPAPGTAIPGEPARLQVSAQLHATGVAGPDLVADLADAAGVSYRVPLGPLAADGRPHVLTAAITTGQHAEYPLRLTGFVLEYLQAGTHVMPGTLRIGPVRAAAAAGRPGAALPVTAAAGLVTATGGPAVFAPSQAVVRATRGVLTMTFRTGQGHGKVKTAAGVFVSAADGPAPSAVPALATRAFLAASGLRVGSSELVNVQGVQLRCDIVGSVVRFPTATGGAGALIVNQEELQSALRALGIAPLPVSQWWLATSGRPRLSGLPPGTSVVTDAAVARSLGSLPLSVAPLQALLAIAAAALLLACGAFVVSVATGRDTRRDVALLDALGARSGQVVWLQCLQQAMVAVPAAAAGLALGVLLSRLIVPAVSLTSQAAHPIPPVLVRVPWPAAIGTTVVIAVLPVVVAAFAATRPIAAAWRLRVEEET